MRIRYFTKHYETPGSVASAARHHAWLAEHVRPLRLPGLSVVGPTSLTYERIDGRPARPEDLPSLAALLGDAHGAAWTSDLRPAALNTPHRFRDGTAFDDYIGPRETALRRRLEQGHLPDRAALQTMLGLLEKTAEGPTAFYKDSNPRNFIVTEAGGIYTVDTDDLTLAPMGYDLAKLIVTLSLTYGPLPAPAIDAALLAYNEAAERHATRLGTTDRERLDDFLALHSVLTAPYVGRNGYRYSWPRPYLRGSA
ncbi:MULTISPECIES: phosphotransferase [Streptomyces]|uniref:Phosphotransferase n=1 Tax=Streptomyces antibioticus TaxID=1890 RepID=A0AAE6Y4I2_STRAT|nr:MULTISPECIES: phosphotransferase [Streptomyces]MCX5167355.1 phosphotransferase [Streptomyces antibioticus]OOQ55302.1 phosphotransferase [Streptomyces antibioticus]QIT42943.1 phosphotransferase [Streptomyces antibioticus]